MKVTGTNLVNVCKLIFKISKDKSKDTLFREQKVICKYFIQIIVFVFVNLFYHAVNIISGYDFPVGSLFIKRYEPVGSLFISYCRTFIGNMSRSIDWLQVYSVVYQR